MSTPTTAVAGIDTGKARLDIAVHGRPNPSQVDNNAAGWRQLIRQFKAEGVELVGIEASGGYERGVVAALRKAGFRVRLHQPLQVKAFAAMRLQRAKNDRLDATLIAAFTALIDPQKPEPIPHDPRLDAFANHLTFIDQAVEDATRASLRLEHQTDPRLRRRLEADARQASKRAGREFERLVAELRSHADLAERLDLVLSIPGIGLKTAVQLIVGMPELGHVTREQAAALAGLAPFDHDSGQHTGERHIAGGRARVRTALYTAALPASYRWNPALVDLRIRLQTRGKTHKQALVACARKLITYVNAVLHRGTPWIVRDQTA